MTTSPQRVPFSYLDRQFEDLEGYLDEIRKVAKSGDFTLGGAVSEFENRFASLCQMPYAVSVGSGTDAITLSLKMLGVGPGDEVITTPTTFIATIGPIVATGARPVFVDSEDGFVIDPELIEKAITPNTKAILPVHYTGNVADMPRVAEIADQHGIPIIEDACQSIMGSIDGKPVGSWGKSACFSLHPLKNLNVWGDGGVIVTRFGEFAERLRLYRNHGLANRDEVEMFGVNSRLDSVQAAIGNRLIGETESITTRRIANAEFYDQALAALEGFVSVPVRRAGVRHVYHLYILRVARRNELLAYLNDQGVEAKVHYPIPMHLQPAAAYLGYKVGDFPVCESDCESIITLPAHQHLTQGELDYTVEAIRRFYGM